MLLLLENKEFARWTFAEVKMQIIVGMRKNPILGNASDLFKSCMYFFFLLLNQTLFSMIGKLTQGWVSGSTVSYGMW